MFYILTVNVKPFAYLNVSNEGPSLLSCSKEKGPSSTKFPCIMFLTLLSHTHTDTHPNFYCLQIEDTLEPTYLRHQTAGWSSPPDLFHL